MLFYQDNCHLPRENIHQQLSVKTGKTNGWETCICIKWMIKVLKLQFFWSRKLLSRDWHLISFITLFAIVLWWTLICEIWSRYAIDIWAFFLCLRQESFPEQHRDLCILIYLWVLSNKRFCCDYWVSELLHGGNFRQFPRSLRRLNNKYWRQLLF